MCDHGGLAADPGDAVPELEPVEIPLLTPTFIQCGLVFELGCLL